MLRYALLAAVLLAPAACKPAKNLPHAGQYLLDTEAMREQLEARIKDLPAEAQASARQAAIPLLDAVGVELNLAADGTGEMTVRKLTVTEDEKTVTGERRSELEWDVGVDGKIVLTSDEEPPSSCKVQGSGLVCITGHQPPQTILFTKL